MSPRDQKSTRAFGIHAFGFKGKDKLKNGDLAIPQRSAIVASSGSPY